MHIIPVIDVRHGIAVRAVAGDRAAYRPLVTPLVDPRRSDHRAGAVPQSAAGLSPLAVARGFRNLYPFETIYMADLDAIEGRHANVGAVAELTAALPHVQMWIDAGRKPGEPWSTSAVSVFGSEVLDARHADRPIPDNAVLSLDFRGDTFVGPQALLAQSELWPSRIIVMTLARVGSDGGPDLARIAEIALRAPRCRIYAAGGIRDVSDLMAARDAGAAGALIASALHAQKIKADDLEEIIGP